MVGARPYLVFYGTQVAVVHAPNKRVAFERFVELWARRRGAQHLIPPSRSEVNVRRPRPEDAAWCRNAGSAAFEELVEW